MENPAVNTNPWKGLNFYKEGEIIYGRNNEIESLSQYILNNTQTVLYGKSGIGKSSILNAGVFPIARRHGLIPVGIRLDHSTSVSYMRQIENAIVSSGVDVHEIQPAISESSETLWEYLHRNIFFDQDGNRAQLLLVLDQFEEIFTLQKDEKKKLAFFDELADLINDVTPLYIVNANKSQQTVKDGKAKEVEGSLDDFDIDLDIDEATTESSSKYLQKVDYHVVFTLREDFLSFLERYTKFIPVMKSNRYALLPLNEEQAAEIIMKPRKGLVEQDVAKLIIQKVTGRTDFSLGDEPEIDVDAAILSLYLSRIYIKKKDSDAIITAELVNQFSDDIIKDFYEESVADIPVAEIEKIEDQLLTYDGRRNNVSRNDLVSEGISEGVIDTLVEDRKLLRQFSYRDDIRVEFMHDILCPVVDARISLREETKKKEEERIRQEEEKQRILLEEKAKREQIEREAEEERNRLKAEAIRTRKRNRRRLYIVGAFVLALLLGIFSYFWYYEWEHESYYAQFERINGWPKGVGKELSSEERHRLPLYYKLSHKGYLGYDTDVEVCSSNSRLPRIPRIFTMEVCEADSDSHAQDYLTLLSHIKSIHFEAGEKDRLNKEVIKGENDSVLYYVNYFEVEGQVWAQFVSSQGQAMTVRDNGLDRIKMSWYVTDNPEDNRNGRVASMMYFDALGVSKAGANGVYGYQLYYSDDGQTTTVYSLDEYGRPLDATYNVVLTSRDKNDRLDKRYALAKSVPDSLMTPAIGPNGFWREVGNGNERLLYLPGEDDPSAKCHITTNNQGNTLQVKMEGSFPAFQPAITNYTYAEGTGYRTSEEKLNADGRPFASKDGIYMRKWQYDNNGQPIVEERYNTQKEKVYAHYVKRTANTVRNEIEDVNNAEYPILIRIDSISDKHTTTAFYGKDNKPVNYKSSGEKVPCHRIVMEVKENQRTTRYFRYDNEDGKVHRQDVTIDSEDGTVASFYCKKESFDNDGNTASKQLFDKDGHIVKSMVYFYQNGQNIGRAVMGIDGVPVRCPLWEEEGFGYYKIYYNKDFSNSYASIAGVNEWERPSIFYDGFERSYKQVRYLDFKGWQMTKDKTDYYLITNAHKQFIFDIDDRVTATNIPYLHILDKTSPLYVNGLRDGDRITKLGQWRWKQPEGLLASEWQKLTKEQVEVEVLRPTVNGLVKKTFTLRVDTDKLDLAEYHILALTQEELQMIDKTK